MIRWLIYLMALGAAVVAGVYLYMPYNDGPLVILPGGKFRGEEATAGSWEFASAYQTLQLEMRPSKPYSVTLNFVLRDDKLYIDPAPTRRWYTYLVENPDVRVRFDKDVYRAHAVHVTDESEIAGMDPEREIYRLELKQ